MFGTEYVGKHRVLESKEIITTPTTKTRWTRRLLVPFAVTMVAVFGIGSAAFASPVYVVSGDTFSQLVKKHCGTTDWQSVSFSGRNKNLIYAGETIDLKCSDTISASSASTKKATTTKVATKSAQGWYNPLPKHSPSNCNYGQWRGSYRHAGEDYPAPTGTPIRAAHSGYVKTAWGSGAGNYTVITHDGVAEVYMHQSRFAVRSGWVKGGQVIGYVGSTGDSTGPHLHFEIHPWGLWKGTTNPVKWLANRGVRIGC